MAREVSALTSPGATMLLLTWVPGRRGNLPRGMMREDLETVFSEWAVTVDDSANVADAPAFIQRAEPHFFRLRRT